MLQENSIKWSFSYALAAKVRDYFMLMKFTLSFLVVFSCVIGYLLAPEVTFNFSQVFLLFFSGLCITGSANTINQIMERRTDSLMRRTASRPLPSGRMKPGEAGVFAAVTGLVGLLVLERNFNMLSAGLSLISIVLYGFVYTPWKKWNSLAVLVGAIPGALPPLIGWVAGTGTISAGAWSLFALQFLWQFPHFWAIGWVAFEDYKKAGFKLLPAGDGRSRFTALQIMLYILMMMVMGLWPYTLRIYGSIALAVGMAGGLFLLQRAWKLYRRCDAASARSLMFGAYIYLMVTQLVMLADKL